MNHRSLKHQITLSLAVKLAALIIIGFALFGPGDRVYPTAESMGARLAGDSR